MRQTTHQEADNDKLDQILQKLEQLERNQKRLEARQKKIINLQTKGLTSYEEMEEEQLFTKLAQKVCQAPNGITSNQVESLFNCSKPTALDKMKKMDNRSEKIDLAKGKGRKPDRLVHKRFGIARMT